MNELARNDAKYFAKLRKGIMRHWQLYLIMLLPIIYVIIFRYVPIWGSQIAFKDYKLGLGVQDSPWADPLFKHFAKFFSGNSFRGCFSTHWGYRFTIFWQGSCRRLFWPSG